MADPKTITICIPDLGLSQDQINELKAQLQNQVVTTLGAQTVAAQNVTVTACFGPQA
jgi:hypothetical protein